MATTVALSTFCQFLLLEINKGPPVPLHGPNAQSETECNLLLNVDLELPEYHRWVDGQVQIGKGGEACVVKSALPPHSPEHYPDTHRSKMPDN